MLQRGRIAALLAAGLLVLPGFSGCSDDGAAETPDSSGADSGPSADAGEHDATAPTLTPTSGASTGYFEVRAGLAGLAISAKDVAAIHVGGVKAYGLKPGDSDIAFMVQGHPTGGAVDVVMTTKDGKKLTHPKTFTYDAALDPRFARVFAFGASITQGTQRGVPGQRAQLRSPAMMVARQLGAYFPLPLFIDPLFPELKPSDIGPPPACEVPDIVSFVSQSTGAVMGGLQDPKTGDLSYAVARVDPDITIHNVAVGSSKIRTVLEGPDEDDLGANFLAHLTYLPYGKFFAHAKTSQLDLLEKAKPTLMFSVDLYGNDLIGAIVGEEILEASDATSLKNLKARINKLVPKLAATGAEVFICNLPKPTLIPATAELKAKRLAAALPKDVTTLTATIDKEIAALNKLTADANAALQKAADAHKNVHVVDLAKKVFDIEATGIEAGKHKLTVGKFGGLLSLDGVHFSDSGNAMAANEVIRTINKKLGTKVPLIDLDKVAANDRETAEKLKAKGLFPAKCQ